MVFGVDDAIMLALGGGSLLSGILGQNKQAKLAKQQMAQQQAISQQEIELEQQAAQLARAGQVDQYGNKLSYDPTTNTWHTALSATGQQMSDADRSEQLKQLQYDAPLARGELLQAAARRSREGSTADALGQQLNDQISGNTAVKGSDIASSLRRSRVEAANAGMRQATRAFNTNAVRTGMGVGAYADALSEAGKNNADYMAQTMGNPDLEGMNAAEELNSTKRGSLVDAYSAMASRATGSPGFQYSPNGMSSTLAQSLSSARGGAASGVSGAASGIGQAGRNLQGTYSLDAMANPNYSKAFGQAATLFDSYGGDIIGALSRQNKSRGAGGSGSFQISDSYGA
jgi:hypothetical protein